MQKFNSRLASIWMLAITAYVLLGTLYPEVAISANLTIRPGQTSAQVTGNLMASFGGWTQVIGVCLYLVCAWCLLQFVMKLIAHSKQPERIPMREPAMYFVAAILAGGAPEVLGFGISSLLGGGAGVVNYQGF